MKNVQISEELFFALLKYHLLEMDDVYLSGYWQNELYFKDIRKQILEDFRFPGLLTKQYPELYTKYKTAPTEEEREKARQEYLKKVGMHRSFRW